MTARVAIISGGLGDIGQAIAMALATDGVDIAICDLAPDIEAQALIDEIKALGRRARYDRVDVSNAAAVQAWVDLVEQSLGVASIVIANAAIVKVAPLLDLTAEYWRKELSVNLDGAFHVATGAARKLVNVKQPGRIVFVGSWAAEHVHLQIPAYCVAKAGLRMLAKCMAGDLARHGILVNEIAPGFVDAGLATRMTPDHEAEREKSRRHVPTGELIQPADVAREVVHLCDPSNRHMTGALIVMDGGLSLFGSGVLRDD